MEPPSNLGDFDSDPVSSDGVGTEENARFSEEEIEDGIEGARFSYLFNFFGVPFCLIPFLKRENAYSYFHAQQALLLWAVGMGSLLIGWSLLWITLKAMWIFLLGGGCSLALNVVGYQRVMNENHLPLPLVGPLAASWFPSWREEEEEIGEGD